MTFVPVFKEGYGLGQFMYQDGKWIECSESAIEKLWIKWISSDNPAQETDDNGRTVYGNLIEEKQ